MRVVVLPLLALALSTRPLPAGAADLQTDPAAIGRAAIAVLRPLETAEAIIASCNRSDPGGAAMRQTAFDQWRGAQPLPAFETRFAALAARAPALLDVRRSLGATIEPKVAEMVAKQPVLCSQPQTMFAAPAMRLEPPIGQFLELASRVPGVVVPGAAEQRNAAQPGAPASAGSLYSLAQLSVVARSAMDAAAPRGEGRPDRRLQDAREEAGRAALQRLGGIAFRARAVDDRRLREWRGEEQSRFGALCRSFATPAAEAQFKASTGQDVLVTGSVIRVSEDDTGGSIAFDQCRLPASGSTDSPRAALPEAGGLMLRPPEAGEAFVGPGKGIDPRHVDRVVYAAKFQTAMDGFGNGYTRRDEDIYVLIDDGTAYHHHWPFPFTDLNVDLSKRREPDRWMTWTAGRGSPGVTLTQSGGAGAGKETVIDKPEYLKPIPPGSTFEHRYFYLNVGMGGIRRDRSYAFHADGTVKADRSRLVAASLGYGAGAGVSASGPGFAFSGGTGGGPGFIAAQGPSETITAAYRIDGWGMTLTGPGGASERHMVAGLASEAGMPPDSMIIDGQVYWTNTK